MVGLAARLYLGGAGTPRRYFAWGQAVRLAVLAVVLVHAMLGLDILVLLTWRRHLVGWFPALPASLAGAVPGGAWATVINVVDCVWIVIFVALVLGHHRTARVVAALAIALDLVFLLQAQFAGLHAERRSGRGAPGSCSTSSWSWPWPRSTGTPRRPRAGPGCWPCPATTSWCPCRCW